MYNAKLHSIIVKILIFNRKEIYDFSPRLWGQGGGSLKPFLWMCENNNLQMQCKRCLVTAISYCLIQY